MSILFDDEHPHWNTQTRIVLFEKYIPSVFRLNPIKTINLLYPWEIIKTNTKDNEQLRN